MAKKATLLGLFGYIAGCAVGLFFTLQSENIAIATALLYILPGGIPGAIAMGTMVLEPWSTAFWIMLAVVAIGYFIVWLIMYQCYKKQVRKLNELLKESQEAKENHPQI